MTHPRDRFSLERFRGCAAGVTLEALGVPHEALTSAEILELTGGTGITGLQPALRPPSFPSLANIPLGGTSDDWQLWRAVARSLLHRGGMFDRIDIAREHVLELERGTDGWGSSTEDGVLRMRQAFEYGGVERLYPPIPPRKMHPPVPGVTDNPSAKGCGNGVAMKVGPLAAVSLMEGCTHDTLWENCRVLGEMTHPNPRAWVAAYALAWCTRLLLDRNENAPPISRRDDLAVVIRGLVNHLDRREPDWDDRMTDRLRRLTPAALASPEALREAVGTNCYALESVTFAIGSFVRHPTNARLGVLEVLNAGGDTDTNVGMYASLVGANAGAGAGALPVPWLAQIPNSVQALAVGEALHTLVTGAHTYHGLSFA